MYLYVGQLRENWGFSAGEAARLANANIGPRDLAMMLTQDPMANGQVPVDPTRFAPTPYTFDYKPVPTCPDNGNASTTTVALKSSNVTTNTDTRSSSYTVGMTIASSTKPGVTYQFKAVDSFTYTNSKTDKVSSGTSSNQTLQFGQPFCTYQGPTAGRVYIDTLYRTYLFTLDYF